MKPCALCKLEKPLRRSHIVPEFMYQEMYDPKHKFFALSRQANESVRHFQKGLREQLLCGDCEQLLSQYEHHAAGVFYGNAKQPVKIKRDGSLLFFEELDYRKLKLFFLSLLWRFGTTSLEEFKGARIGAKHMERLRDMILREHPGEWLEYPCYITAVMFNGKHLGDFITPPMGAKIESHHVWQFVAAGFLFSFIVSSHPLGNTFASLRQMFLKKDGTMILRLQELREISFLHEYCCELGEAQRQRKQAGKK